MFLQHIEGKYRRTVVGLFFRDAASVTSICRFNICVGEGKFNYPIVQSLYDFYQHHFHAMHVIGNRFSFANTARATY